MSIRVPKWLLDFTGKIYLSKTPMFISYNPQFHKLKGFEIQQIIDVMEPGDILLSRQGGYVNTLAIPGYWTHAAISINDNLIGHAIGKGTGTENQFDFFRCDGAAVLRPKTPVDIDSLLKRVMVTTAKNIPYDYEFKADNGAIYCTEFVDMMYEGLFKDDYAKDAGGGSVLIPDGIQNSDEVSTLIEFRH